MFNLHLAAAEQQIWINPPLKIVPVFNEVSDTPPGGRWPIISPAPFVVTTFLKNGTAAESHLPLSVSCHS